MVEAKATMKYVRTSPRKMRRAVDLIRGTHVEEARLVLIGEATYDVVRERLERG